MANGTQSTPNSLKDIVNAVFEAGSLDQAPQESPQEKPKRRPTLAEAVNEALTPRQQFTPTREPGLAGFGKGALGGIVRPFRVFGLDPDLSPARVVEGERFPATPATGSRIIGDLIGMGVPLTLFTSGAGAAIQASGLAAALGRAGTEIATGALGFGLFEAGASESPRDIPENFAKGAAVGVGFEIARLKLLGLLRGKSESQLIDYGVADITYPWERTLPAGQRRLPAPQRAIEAEAGPGQVVVPPKGAGGGPGVVSPSGGRVVETASTVVGEPVRLTPKVYQTLLERASGPVKAALEAAEVGAKGVVATMDTGTRVQLRRELEAMLSEGGLGPLAQHVARLRSELSGASTPAESRPEFSVETVMFESFDEYEAALSKVNEEKVFSVTNTNEALRTIPEVRRPPLMYSSRSLIIANRRLGEGNSNVFVAAPRGVSGSYPIVGYAELDPAKAAELGVRLPTGSQEFDVVLTDDGTTGFVPRNDPATQTPLFFDSRALSHYEEFAPEEIDLIHFGEGEVPPAPLYSGWRGAPVGFNSEGVVVKMSGDAYSNLRGRFSDLDFPSGGGTEGSLEGYYFFPHALAKELQSRLSRAVVRDRVEIGSRTTPRALARLNNAQKVLAQLEAYAPNLDDIVADLQRVRISPQKQLKSSFVNVSPYPATSFSVSKPSDRAVKYIKIDPDALGMERAFFGHGSTDDVFARLGNALDTSDQLSLAAARVGGLFRFGGSTVLMNVVNPGRVIKALKKVDPMLQFAVHVGEAGKKDLLIATPIVIGPRALVERFTFTETMNVVERIVKEGTDAHVTFNETLRVLRSPVVGEEISTPSIFTGYKTSELGVTGALGDYTRWDADSGRIRVATGDVPPDEILPTLIHEFGHHFFSEITRINVLARGASMFDRNDFYGNLAYAFPLDRQADFQLMFGKHIITKEEFNKLARIRVTDMYPLFTPLEEAASKAFGVPIKVSKNPDMMNSLIFAAPDGITIKPKDVQKVFREILRDHKSGQMLRNSYKGIRYEIARDAGQEVAISMSPGTAAEIPTFSEIVEMTIEATAKKIARQRNPRGSPSWIRALQRVILDDKYYLKDSELAARVMELMWRDMAVAKEVGPNVTKMFSKAILDVSPKLAIVLKGQTIEAVNAILHDKVIVGQVEVLRTIDEFKSTFGLLTAEQKHQFSRWGVHAWQSGYYDGKTVLAGDEFWIHAGEPYMKAIIPTTGEINNIPISKFRPSYATSFTKSKEGATRVARRIKNGELEYIPFRIEEADGEHATLMILPIDQASVHYVEGYEGLVDWLATNNPELRDVVVPHGIATQIAMNALKRLGEDHVMLFNDNGAYKIISGNPIRADLTTDTPFQTMLTRTRGPVGSFDSINGKSGEHIINLDNRTIAEALLRQEFHVNERDLPYVIDEVVDALKRSDLIGIDPRMFGLEHPLSRAVPTSQPKWSVENAGYDSYYHLTRLERQANQVGAKIDRTLDGRYRVEVDSNEAPREAGVFIEPEEVEEFLYRARQKAEDFGGRSRRSQETGSYEHLGDADNIGRTGTPGEPPPPGGGGFGGNRGGRPNSGGTGGFNGGGSRGPRFNETFEGNTPPPGPGWISRIRDATMFFGSFFTAMENSAKVIERNFGLPAYTRIFQPLQEAIRTVDREMMAKRPGKDWSFHSKLKDIEKLTWKLNKEQREHVIRWLEAMSREEIIRPGGLSQRGMRPAEIKMADELRRLGLQHELPQLLSQWRAMRNLVDGRKKFLRTYKQMAQVKLPPELRARIEELYKLSNLRKSEWTLDELGARLNLNEGEKAVIELLEATSKWPKDRFSIFLVGRLAAADPLPRGFKSMRDVIAARYKMNPTQIQLGKEMEALFNESFKASGIDPKRYLGGYYPHMRQYIEKSIMPDAPWIQDLLPKETRFTANKFRTGELDPYTMEPLKVAYKHVRGMLMHEHFDKHLPDVRTVLSMLKRTDSRAFRIMNEYVHELQGRPHASFTRLQEIIEGTAEILGTKVDRELSSQIVNSIAALTYQATIPFRAALIARNYFQMVQMIVPRVGMSDFIEGLKIALTKEGFQQAKRANAVTENVAPIISQEAIFDFTNLKLSRRMQRLTEVGFRWYQKADDLGRATAFHAQRVRINRGLSKLNKGMYGNPRDPKSFMRFLEDSKVTTFDALDQEQFVKLMRAGNTEGAKSYLGEMLARETIFRYGHANHPAGWGSVGGRLFGQFGTWPVQYKDYLLTGLTRGTKKDKIEFLLWHSGINAAIVAGGAKLGYDLNSWVSYPSLQYTGGPWADIAIDFVKLLGGSDMEQAMALQSLKFQFVPTLNDPRSIILPTSYAINDLTRLLEGGGRVDEALGFRRIEPDANSSALLTF